MRKISKKIIVFALLISAVLPFCGINRSSYAAEGAVATGCTYRVKSDRSFLGLVPWYDQLCSDSSQKTVVIPQCDKSDNSCSTLSSTIWQIAFNVLQDLAVIAAYLTIGFAIYGGYQYLLAQGSTEKAMNGKKTIITAFIGLAITMLAYVIFNVIKFAMLQNNGSVEQVDFGNGVTVNIPNTQPNLVFTGALSWIIGIAGLVALIFVVYGGALYVSSRGEPQKIETAKKTIIYSVLGLFIVGVAEAGIALVSSGIRNARDEAIQNARNNTSQVITIKKEQA